MKSPITSCLLDRDNQYCWNGKRIGQMIAGSGKEHLWEARAHGLVDTIVFHYISACEVLPANPFLTDRILAIFAELGVSSHYLITREGSVLQLVPKNMKAWHCGGSIMPFPDCREGVNEFSLGIELVGTHDSGFTDAQYRSLAELCHELEDTYQLRFRYVGHQDISGQEAVRRGLRKEAKIDPGPLFEWARLKAALGEYGCASDIPVSGRLQNGTNAGRWS